MYDNTHMQTVAKDFSRSRQLESTISGTFVPYKRAEQSDQQEK